MSSEEKRPVSVRYLLGVLTGCLVGCLWFWFLTQPFEKIILLVERVKHTLWIDRDSVFIGQVFDVDHVSVWEITKYEDHDIVVKYVWMDQDSIFWRRDAQDGVTSIGDDEVCPEHVCFKAFDSYEEAHTWAYNRRNDLILTRINDN